MLFQKERNINPVNIKGYNEGELNISGQRFNSPVLLDASSIQPYHSKSFSELDIDELIKRIPEETEVLLIGTGGQHMMLSPRIIKQFNDKGIALEVMATRPACHTFQVLVYEMRKVVALLFP